ncbi:hypothetical protein MLD38_010838 [Melastoma candidum]|uniref:Uncharacterized protein n=1 Tax=Melastoma candidum TaxID=119954 RepID=A0ACB9R5A2_9MYRT|nr:hypothetical protein MLD38_010838 [Melastoma candidum]
MATPTPFSPLQSFPAGVRILAVDSDPVSLRILQTMLLACSYQVTTCTCALDALSMLGSRDAHAQFDLVMTEVHLPDINGLQLLGHLVNLGIRLPVILFSEDQDNFMIMRGLSLGALLVLAKPFKMDVLLLLWQLLLPRTTGQYRPSATSDQSNSNISVAPAVKIRKKKRFVWSSERHDLFVAAIKFLGHKNAVPKKILEYMQTRCRDPDLDRHVISSHLQKFRESTTGAELQAISPIPESFQGSGELEDVDYLLEEFLQTDLTTCLDAMFQ